MGFSTFLADSADNAGPVMVLCLKVDTLEQREEIKENIRSFGGYLETIDCTTDRAYFQTQDQMKMWILVMELRYGHPSP